MNILEAILQAQGGQAAQQLGRQFGLDGGQTRSALEALLPALAGAVHQNVQAPGGLDALMGALERGGHSRYLEQPAALSDPSTVADGNGILGHLFGDRQVSREVAQRASAQTGIGSDVLKKMLPVVAAMVMAGLAQGARSGGAGPAFSPGAGAGAGGGLGGMLGNVLGGALGGGGASGAGGLGSVLGSALGGAGRPAGGPGGVLDMLSPMLDRNRNGTPLDDILGMAAGFLTRR